MLSGCAGLVSFPSLFPKLFYLIASCCQTQERVFYCAPLEFNLYRFSNGLLSVGLIVSDTGILLLTYCSRTLSLAHSLWFVSARLPWFMLYYPYCRFICFMVELECSSVLGLLYLYHNTSIVAILLLMLAKPNFFDAIGTLSFLSLWELL